MKIRSLTELGPAPTNYRKLQWATQHYDLFSSPAATTPRNFTQEQLQTLAGFQQTAPGYLALEQQYQPQYGQLALSNQAQNLFGYNDPAGAHQPGTLELGQAAQGYRTAGDLSLLNQYGPGFQQAFLAANPYLAGSLNNLSSRTQDTPILSELNNQALSALQSGGQLSPQDARALDQQSRAAYSARGQLNGNQSIASELLGRDAAVRQRQQQAQQLASGVQGLNQGQNDFVGRASQIFSTSLSDPIMAILGRSSGAASSGGGGGGGQQIGTGARIFDPLNPYAQDLYNTNFNSQAATNISNANNQAATTSALLGLGGSFLGLLSDRRLKKNITRIGKTPMGLGRYRYQYRGKNDKRWFEGPMAQDVEKKIPGAVHTDAGGHKFIDMGKVDAPFGRIDFKTGKLVKT